MSTHITPNADLRSLIESHKVTVLLVDDQQIIGQAVSKMLAGIPDIDFHYVSDPMQAIASAESLHPTVILLDLVMPEVDGLTLLRYMRAHPTTSQLPIVVLSTKEEASTKAEAFALGANDYMVKLPAKEELEARVRYHSKGYISLLERNEAYQCLEASQKLLVEELNKAADYVISMLPAPLKGAIASSWVFVPSVQLGGDSFGYHWLDEDHLAIYLLDVCGHGVGAALLSVSVMNVIRSRSLANCDFRDPAAVLRALNEAFPMESNNNMFFTMVYCVYNAQTRRLCYSTGGHPPLLLYPSADAKAPIALRTPGLVVGGMPDMDYQNGECTVDSGAKLYVFSDGVFELTNRDGSIANFNDFVRELSVIVSSGGTVEAVIGRARDLQGRPDFDDDYSMLEFRF